MLYYCVWGRGEDGLNSGPPKKQKVRQPRIELRAIAWKAIMLPLHHWRQHVEIGGIEPPTFCMLSRRSTN